MTSPRDERVRTNRVDLRQVIRAKHAAHLHDNVNIEGKLVRRKRTILKPNIGQDSAPLSDDTAPKVKVGIVGSHSRTGQAVQASASYFVPGDMSRVRSPIRSTAFRTLTPGTPNMPGRQPTKRIINRCPPGFENGGRFTNSAFTNCGQRLFGPVGIAKLVGSTARAVTGQDIRPGVENPISARRIAGAGFGRATDIVRDPNVNIPVVSKWKPKEMLAAVTNSIGTVSSSKTGMARLIRRDGYVLDAFVPVERLGRVRRSDDMFGGFLVSRVTSPNEIGRHEIAAMSMTGMAGIVLTLPGGSHIRIEKTDLTSEDKVPNILRYYAAAVRLEADGQYGGALQRIVEKSNGKLTYKESFPNIKEPNELVVIERDGRQITVRRWVYETFMAESAPGRNDGDKPWSLVKNVRQAESGEITTVDAAKPGQVAKALDEGSDLSGIADAMLTGALTRSKAERADIGAGRTRFTLKNGDSFTLFDGSPQENVARKATADVFNTLGIPTPTVRFASEDHRKALETDVKAVYRGARIDPNLSIADANPADFARIMLADFLVDNQRRNAGSLIPVRSGKQVELIPYAHDTAFLGRSIKKGDLVNRSKMDLAEYMTRHHNWGQSMMNQYVNIKRSVVTDVFEELIKDAEGFDWDGYISRLSINGLSDIEKRQLEMMKSLYASRLNMLRQSKKSILSALGVMK